MSDEAVEEIRWWLDLMAEADRLHRQLPGPMMHDIEASAGDHEVMRLATMLASTSSATRQRIESTLERSLAALRVVNGADAPAARLRVVEGD